MQIYTVASGRGSAWLTEGFSYFKKSAGIWIGACFILLILSAASSVIPFMGLVFQLFLPVVFAGLILGCEEIDNGGDLNIKHMIAGFNNNLGSLILLGVLYTFGQVLILIAMAILLVITIDGSELITRLMDKDIQVITENYLTLLIIILVGLMLYVPLLMAFWFGPTLIILEEQGAVVAMKNSFKGCLVNVIPFLIYGVVGMVLCILATIPLMLGWFILTPMIIASLYIAYKDIFKSSGAG